MIAFLPGARALATTALDEKGWKSFAQEVDKIVLASSIRTGSGSDRVVAAGLNFKPTPLIEHWPDRVRRQ